MKKIIIVFVLSICSLSLLAQRPTAKKDQIPAFFNSTLLVVTDNNQLSEYNSTIREAVQKNWRITKFDFISTSEFESKRLDPNNSFLILTETRFPKDKSVIAYDFLSIILGGNYPSINEMPELCTFPLKYSDSDESTMAYKLPVIIGFFNQHVKNIQDNPKLLKDKKYSFYTKQKKSIAKKTFYLIADEQLPEYNTAQKIRPVFSGRVVMIGQDELANLIRKRATNVVFLHKVGPESSELQNTRCYIIVLGTDNTLYHFDYHFITPDNPNGISSKIWKIFASYTN